MDTQTSKKIEKYASLVKEAMPNSMIVLFGSYAKGTEKIDSDIDIAVIVDELTGDYLDISTKLFSLTRKVDTSIEPKLVVRKDNDSGFLESILKYGKVIM